MSYEDSGHSLHARRADCVENDHRLWIYRPHRYMWIVLNVKSGEPLLHARVDPQRPPFVLARPSPADFDRSHVLVRWV